MFIRDEYIVFIQYLQYIDCILNLKSGITRYQKIQCRLSTNLHILECETIRISDSDFNPATKEQYHGTK
jgi:hypothetical protein